jgi:23S rRNA (cytidine1920-2'-O)/16S rRNA (cytidine1409-2'-O)-methyltransferase
VIPQNAAGTGRSAFVSRGGEKLQAALDRFVVSVAGARALDAGASTGGFTDCLLSNGAAEVVAVDVAYGALAWSLRTDPRVRVLERTNLRSIDVEAIGGRVSVVAADLAFISLRTVRDALLGVCGPAADLILLVKPQFEAPRAAVPRGGVVRDPSVWEATLRSVAASYAEAGSVLAAACASPIRGRAGNREFFLHLRAPGAGAVGGAGAEVILEAIAESP